MIFTQIKAKVQWNLSHEGVSAYDQEFFTKNVFQCIETLN